ncbi:MAG: hypothetical protein SangKO_051390 [Sandaracinaceae bacterium]
MRGCLAVLFALWLLGCGSEGVLVVSLRTDYGAQTEVRLVSLTLSGPGETVERELPIDAGADLLEGIRLAEIDGLTAGEHALTVRLVGASGRAFASRDVRLRVQGGAKAVTVLITRDCAGVVCPAGDPALSACLDGACVDPACTPETPERCPPPSCSVDADCAAPAASCGFARCRDGACFELGDDAMCGADEACDPGRGCVSTLAGPCEGSLDCPLFEAACVARLDADRCMTTALDATAPTQWIFDLSGRACVGVVTGDSVGLLSDAPALFRDAMVWSARDGRTGECRRYDVSLIDGSTSLNPAPCGTPVNVSSRALGWIDRVDELGRGVLRVPGEADRPFTLPFGWTGMFAVSADEVTMQDLDSNERALLSLRTLEHTVMPGPNEALRGAWRDRNGTLLWMARWGGELVRTDAAGMEIERVPLAELPGGGPGDDSFVGLTCTF